MFPKFAIIIATLICMEPSKTPIAVSKQGEEEFLGLINEFDTSLHALELRGFTLSMPQVKLDEWLEIGGKREVDSFIHFKGAASNLRQALIRRWAFRLSAAEIGSIEISELSKSAKKTIGTLTVSQDAVENLLDIVELLDSESWCSAWLVLDSVLGGTAFNALNQNVVDPQLVTLETSRKVKTHLKQWVLHNREKLKWSSESTEFRGINISNDELTASIEKIVKMQAAK